MSSLDYTVEDLARRNGPELLACQLQIAERNLIEQHNRHMEELRTMRATLDEAQRIGVRVLDAERRGRKTVRIADVKDGPR